MAFSIQNWNIANNIVWHVRLSDGGSGIRAELYLSAADAAAQSNPQASGTSGGYGSGVEIIFADEPGAAEATGFFLEAHGWHLSVSGSSGDPAVIFKIKEFVDLEDIEHAIYRNSGLIDRRALTEIDAHTHAKIIREVALGIHAPEIVAGDVMRINSARRGIEQRGQVREHVITGTPNSLISEFSIVSFLELHR